jgi:hypothetical protein
VPRSTSAWRAAGPRRPVRARQEVPGAAVGGQKQRVGIARALATNPKILLCDEATSALDPQTTASVLQLLAEINRELKLTIVLITHEMDVIRRVCDRVAVMDAGVIVEQGSVAEVFLHPQHPTTKRFVQEDEQVDESDQRDDFAHVPGRIVRLTFQGEATYAPLLGTVARETGVDYSILAGRIDRIKDIPYGKLTLAVTGGDMERPSPASPPLTSIWRCCVNGSPEFLRQYRLGRNLAGHRRHPDDARWFAVLHRAAGPAAGRAAVPLQPAAVVRTKGYTRCCRWS